ncbi:hypothetical protein [Desulfosarcina sp.]|uniref:hypothetical protein n=1 Tax=Desulfosarcina sp. TaxID=2027861 RepID=UPI003970F01C
MSHHHDHDHTHDHPHDHGHDHHHGHAPLSFSEKLVKLLDHWIQHNTHHADDYRKWARDARDNGQAEVAELLDSAAELSDTIGKRFRQAAGIVHSE